MKKSEFDPILTKLLLNDWMILASRITGAKDVKELAHHLDVNPNTLTCWMTGMRQPSTKSLKKIQSWFEKELGETITPSQWEKGPSRSHKRAEHCTVKVAAKRIGVSGNTIRRWADNGVLPCKRIGGKRVFYTRMLDNFAKNIGEAPNPKEMSIANAARILGVNHWTLEDWTRRGLVVPTRVLPSGFRFFHIDDVAALVEQRGLSRASSSVG